MYQYTKKDSHLALRSACNAEDLSSQYLAIVVRISVHFSATTDMSMTLTLLIKVKYHFSAPDEWLQASCGRDSSKACSKLKLNKGAKSGSAYDLQHLNKR